MQLRVVERLSVPGKPGKTNEDIAGATRWSTWVLDGATGLGNDPLLPSWSDAAWLTAEFNALLRAKTDDRELPDLFREMIVDVAAKFAACARRAPTDRFEEPSAGMAIARLRPPTLSRPGILEYASLGDCRAILSVGTQLLSTVDSPVLRSLDAKIVAKMRKIRAGNPLLDIEAVSGAVRDDLQENRRKLNIKDGYWVLGTEPAAADAINVRSIRLGEAGSVYGLLVSDGFYRLVDTFPAYSNGAALLDAARRHGLKALMAELRAWEDKDPQCREFMRIKPKDDATALLFKICAGD